MFYWISAPDGPSVTLEFCLMFLSMSLARALWRQRNTANFKHGRVTRNLVIVALDQVGREMRNHLSTLPRDAYSFKGFVASSEKIELLGIDSSEVLGDIADVISAAKQVFADEIIFSARPGHHILRSAIAGARDAGITLRMVPSVSEKLQHRSAIQYVGDLPTIVLHQRPSRALSRLGKRVVDIAVASAGIMVALPFLLGIVLVIKLDSSGPVFYASKRVGFKGRAFACYKFRTMIKNAEKRRSEIEHLNERGEILFKISKDPRITRIGGFLRKYSLDEVPQLWNVLCGDMSLVGPRPPIRSEVAQYEIGHLVRLEVTPGITGLWQVEARQQSSYERYIELDQRYVREWSLWLDCKILFRTVGVVLMGTGC